QRRTVTGKVCSADEPEGIPVVNVRVQGTMVGAITDIDGTYAVEVPQGSGVLVFSFVGFTSQSVTIGNRTEVNVVMLPDVRELSEVVITALGVERNRNELEIGRAHV